MYMYNIYALRKMSDKYIFLQTLLTVCSLCDTKLFKETREKNLIPVYTETGTRLALHEISRYNDYNTVEKQTINVSFVDIYIIDS